MLRSIELENFKAFGRRAKVPLAPITLVFGQNSAGKSSILQALNLLKQTREGRDPSALLLPRADRGTVDLGSFQELLFDHDLDRELRIRLEVNRLDQKRARFLWGRTTVHDDLSSVGLEFAFERKTRESEVQLREVEVLVGREGEDPVPVAWFSGLKNVPEAVTRAFYRRFRPNQALSPKDLRAAKCRKVTRDWSFWEPYFLASLDLREDIVGALRDAESHGPGRRQLSLLDDGELDEAQLSEAREFYSKDYDLESFVARQAELQKKQYLGLEGFMPVVPTGLYGEAGLEWTAFRRLTRHTRTSSFFDAGRLAVDIGLHLDRTLEQVFPLGPFRTPPKRWYIFTGTSPQDVGYAGELLPDLLYRNPGLLEETNAWLERLEIGYELSVESAGARLRDLFEVRLRDQQRKGKVDVSLSDVGFGISQLLPFVVQSLAGQDQIITIEQPEVHVHPRLQADLGDLLAYAAKKQRNQFLIETHSEHLILRLQKLVRDGELSPADVSVLYVQRGVEGSEVLQLRLDEEGDFIDDWPGGFFPERLREIL